MWRSTAVVMLLTVCATFARADVPQTINHQGVVHVNGQPFDGTGKFKFAILNASGVNVWTNDNTNLVLNGVPNTFEDVSVVNGVYSVVLGGTGAGYTMTPIAPTVLSEPERRLRIWFDDDVNGIQQLTPDHPLTSSGYSQHSALEPPVGSVIAWHKSLTGVPALPSDNRWVECNGQVLTDAQSPLNNQVIPNLNTATLPGGPAYPGGRFLRGGTVSGQFQEATQVETVEDWDSYLWDTAGDHAEFESRIATSGVNASILEGPHGEAGFAYAVRPVNMSVVWIMRVK